MAKRAKRPRSLPRLSVETVAKILDELDAWCRRERVGKLTWQRLEDFSGFSRQSLSAHDDIKQRYDVAKGVSRGDGRKVSVKTEDEQVAALRKDLTVTKAIVQRYDERWARYALNAARLGYDLDRLDEPMDPPARAVVRVTRANRKA